MAPTPGQKTGPDPIEPIIWLLALMVVFFAVLVVLVAKWSPSDGQVFQVISGALATIIGIFANRIMPAKRDPTTSVPPGTTITSHADQTVKTPEEPKA